MKLSLIAIGGAFANYLMAKKEYDAAAKEAEVQNLPYLAAISQYDNSKYDQLDKYDKKVYNENAGLDDLLITPILNCGMMAKVAGLSGDMCRCLLELTLQNTGDKVINIKSGLVTDFMLFGKSMMGDISINGINFPITLNPKQHTTIYFSFPIKPTPENPDLPSKARKLSLSDVYSMTDEMKQLRNMILSTTGCNYLTSIKASLLPVVIAGIGKLAQYGTSVTYEPILTADLSFMYNDSENKDIRRAYIRGAKGSCAYWGESYYPNGTGKMWIK